MHFPQTTGEKLRINVGTGTAKKSKNMKAIGPSYLFDQISIGLKMFAKSLLNVGIVAFMRIKIEAIHIINLIYMALV